MDAKLTDAIWDRLVTGKRLDDLGLPLRDGRFDLRGLAAPEPSRGPPRFTTASMQVRELRGVRDIRGVRWAQLDLSKARLHSLRFHDCIIEDCSFEGADCQDWRMWGNEISRTTFRSANLRDSALGGLSDGKRNRFHQVDFTRADLRGTSYVSAEMVECVFDHTNLTKVDFNGTVFAKCRFAGELREVEFYRHARGQEALSPNEMREVDMRDANLRWVEFRNIDVGAVLLPEDDGHLVIHDYVATLDRTLDALKGRSEPWARGLAAVLANSRKWALPGQKVGVFHRADLGEDGARELLRFAGHA